MANPRQVKKRRQPVSSRNSQSKRSKKNMKKVVIHAAEPIKKAWDKTKTVRQNYEALGLMATPNPRLAGGLEALPIVPYALQSHYTQEASTSKTPAAPKPTLGPNGEIPRGYARVIRDADGNIIDVIMPAEDESASDDKNPWGAPMENVEDEDFQMDEIEAEPDYGINRTQGIPMPVEVDGKLARVKVPEKEPTAVVKELEAIANQSVEKKPSHASDGEQSWLIRLTKAHGDDISAMTRDLKLNPWQRTAGQIKRSIARAGGITKLLAMES